jgi:hypothetical protein
LHNRFYGAELSQSDKAFSLRCQHPDWSDKQVAKEAGFSHSQSLYQIDGYKQLTENQRTLAKRNSNIPRGSKNSETGDMDAW